MQEHAARVLGMNPNMSALTVDKVELESVTELLDVKRDAQRLRLGNNALSFAIEQKDVVI